MKLSEEALESAGNLLVDPKRPLAERFRALFTLRNVGGLRSVEFISKTLVTDTSALLKHEAAYCLGQMQDMAANGVLIEVLQNREEHPMVRHEAGEALGAIGSKDMLPILREYSKDPVLEVAQTCQLAVKRLEWQHRGAGDGDGDDVLSKNPYSSVDPTPPADAKLSVADLRTCLLSSEASLYDKYRAMFGLRNEGSDDAVRALGEALVQYKADTTSALFKHEVAYVLGQIQSPVSVPYLRELLEEEAENEMVRHECAEALGSIATDEANAALDRYKTDPAAVVRESIEVALDMAVYENSTNQFHPMDNLSST
jgi:deoxyhypusine monooxygenase